MLTISVFSLLVNLPGFALNKEDVIGAWLFDDGKGEVAKDSSGNGNDGKLIAKPEWVKNGKIGGCLQFTAAKVHNVRVPVTHSNSLTVAMWSNYKNLASNNIGLVHIQAGELDGGNPDTPAHHRSGQQRSVGLAHQRRQDAIRYSTEPGQVVWLHPAL